MTMFVLCFLLLSVAAIALFVYLAPMQDDSADVGDCSALQDDTGADVAVCSFCGEITRYEFIHSQWQPTCGCSFKREEAPADDY